MDSCTTWLDSLGVAERNRIRTLILEHELKMPAIVAHSPLISGDAALSDSYKRLYGAVDLAVDLFPDCPPVINTGTGGSPSCWEQSKWLIVDRVEQVVNYAGRYGVSIAMEPHVAAAHGAGKVTLLKGER